MTVESFPAVFAKSFIDHWQILAAQPGISMPIIRFSWSSSGDGYERLVAGVFDDNVVGDNDELTFIMIENRKVALLQAWLREMLLVKEISYSDGRVQLCISERLLEELRVGPREYYTLPD